MERTMTLLRQAGKTPVHVRRDSPGFVASRLRHALRREAIAILADGACEAETIDTSRFASCMVPLALQASEKTWPFACNGGAAQTVKRISR